jgi:hypothetical protein
MRDLAPSMTVIAGALACIMLLLHQSFLHSLLLALAMIFGTYLFTFVRKVRRPRDRDPALRVYSSQLRKTPEEVLARNNHNNNGSTPSASSTSSAAVMPSASDLAAAEGRQGKPGTTNVCPSSAATHAVYLSTPNALFARIRQLDLTPLIRVELSSSNSSNGTGPKNGGGVILPFWLADQHTPNLEHLKGSKRLIVNYLCGPRLVLRMARYAAGSHRWRPVGKLTGMQLLSLLLPHERYNFVLTSRPARIVISHVGPGSAGGLYAKHALLSELRRVAFAGELWLDERGVVHINNSSGTYQPRDALLPAVEKFLAAALQIQVHAHTRPDKDSADTTDGEEEANARPKAKSC